jgi:hypothetical protein
VRVTAAASGVLGAMTPRRLFFGWPAISVLVGSLLIGVLLLPDACVTDCETTANKAATYLLLVWLFVATVWVLAWLVHGIVLADRRRSRRH